MANNILLTYLVADFAFLIGSILLLVGSLVMNEKINGPKTVDNAPQVLLLSMFPTKGSYSFFTPPPPFFFFFSVCFLADLMQPN